MVVAIPISNRWNNPSDGGEICSLIIGKYYESSAENFFVSLCSSSSSEGTQDTEGSQSTMDEVDMELAVQSDVKCKMCLNNLNKNNRPEVLIQCGTCNGNGKSLILC